LVLALFPTVIFGVEKDTTDNEPRILNKRYFKYWNPYRRILDIQGESQSFYGQNYYEAQYNIDNRIKTVTRIGDDNKPQETYHLIWSKSGHRSEYKIVFHQEGNISRLDKNLYANDLSFVRPGWVADYKSRSDGRPKYVSIHDSLGIQYFSYSFNYNVLKDDGLFSEVIECLYYDSKNEFVGRHLLFWEKGAFLRMIQYFNTDNKIVQTKEFIYNRESQETVRVIVDENGKEIERKIIPYITPDKYAYKFEWTGEAIIDRGLQEIDNLNLAIKFAFRAQQALEKANANLKNSKEEYNKSKKRAKNANRLLKKAESEAKDVKQFQIQMARAKLDAQVAIETMYDAERDAEQARLESAAALATIDAIKTVRNIENYSKKELKKVKKEAKRTQRKANKEARLAQASLQDSLYGGSRTYMMAAYGWPLIVENNFKNHQAGVHYYCTLGRRNMVKVFGRNTDLSLEVHWYSFDSDSSELDFQAISYFLTSDIDVSVNWFWVPTNLETSIKFGGGLVSPGYGATIGSSFVYNFFPTPLTVGLFSQFHWVSTSLDKDLQTYWLTFGLNFGYNFKGERLIPSIFRK